MPQISEKWEIIIGREKFIVSENEMKSIMNAGEARFVRFRDLIVNPAFVQSMKLIERINEQQIEAPIEVELTEEQRQKNIIRITQIKKKIKW